MHVEPIPTTNVIILTLISIPSVILYYNWLLPTNKIKLGFISTNTMVFKVMGKLNPGELAEREEIRTWQPPDLGGPIRSYTTISLCPDIYSNIRPVNSMHGIHGMNFRWKRGGAGICGILI